MEDLQQGGGETQNLDSWTKQKGVVSSAAAAVVVVVVAEVVPWDNLLPAVADENAAVAVAAGVDGGGEDHCTPL